ncbi:dihydroneopterin aldolase [Alkalicoccus saliphilus]|jgi:7,8-dihydroneopterin aldolase/epimerase/oxygenase|uniref:7,8-dihydroneopterin aldolase n=1 Tax=Alkalicoccus saliphilus TaxID=200989 RepID=A0A2T4U460_9BACI|nr:dihydroneopterin aldolase [Alkalicoccus saliphilus]PTL38176.1 dihydroneopterin aldolase [Alkalicoccus saliphilus]
MDKVYVEGMRFYGYHGAFQEETKLGQRFYADVVMEIDTEQAGNTDDLDDTVNYAEVYEAAKEVLEGEPVKLVETLTARTASLILERFAIVDAVTVKVKKPDPPIPGHYDGVAVEIRRERGFEKK